MSQDKPGRGSGTNADLTTKDPRGQSGPEVLTEREFLFLALEADRPMGGGARYSLEGVTEVSIGRGENRNAHREPGPAGVRLVLRLPGSSLSRLHARFLRTPEGWVATDEKSTNGTYVNGRRIERQGLTQTDVTEVGHSFFLLRTYARRVNEPPRDLDSSDDPESPPGFTTLVPPIGDRLAELRQVARSSLPVVLTGATGTGKEILARSIHAQSGRQGPFVALNCGALTKSLAESELFGHVKGSFSGAVADAPGFVRSAHGGTLLLDELADLDRAVQPTLLRVLQEREVVPVGSARPHRVDVRFISTSPHRLEELVVRGELRADLHARLSAFTYAAPLLCERREDLGLLLAALLKRHGVSASTAPRLSSELGLRLLQHTWPLNVRELEQALLRGLALSSDGVISAAQMPTSSLPEPSSASAKAAAVGNKARVLTAKDERLREQLLHELKSAGGNVADVARKLGKARMQLHRWMKRLAIDPEAFRR